MIPMRTATATMTAAMMSFNFMITSFAESAWS
jgi:hypothetical protein